MPQCSVISEMYLRRLLKLLSGSNPLEVTYAESFYQDRKPLLHSLSGIPIVKDEDFFKSPNYKSCIYQNLHFKRYLPDTVANRHIELHADEKHFQRIINAYVYSSTNKCAISVPRVSRKRL
ncbi:unnamed protein product [Trichobilharzia szidati]|nr:unnamed protein product [Trichobilharzia szidati]